MCSVSGSMSDLPEALYPDDIRQENIGNHESQKKENTMLSHLLPDLCRCPRRFRQQFLLCRVAFDQVLHLPEQHLHKNRLWADPTAKKPAKRRRKQNDKNDKGHHRQAEDEKVLRPENVAK